MLMRRNKIIYRLALDSMLAALYFILTYVTIRVGNFHITFASIMVVIPSILFGLPDSIFIALLGEFLNQILTYGISITTPLWILPPLFRALMISCFSTYFIKKNDRLENHIIIYFIVVLVGGLLTSIANTGVTFLDGYIMGYSVNFVLLTTIFRFLINIATSIVVAIVSLPIVKLLRRSTYLESSKRGES